MSSGKVNIELDSSIKGNGFERAVKHIDDLEKSSKKVSASFRMMKKLIGTKAEWMGGFFSIFENFARGGAMGIFASVAGMIVDRISEMYNKLKEFQKKAADEAREAAARLQLAYQNVSLSNLRKELKESVSEAEKLRKAFDAAAAAAKALASARVATASAAQGVELARLKNEAESAKAGESDSGKRGIIDAQYGVKIAEKQAEMGIEAARAAKAAADTEVEVARKKMATALREADNLRSVEDDARAELSRKKGDKNANYESVKFAEKVVKEAAERRAAADDRATAAVRANMVAVESAKAANLKLEQATIDASTSIKEAQAREREVRDAYAKAKLAEAAAARKAAEVERRQAAADEARRAAEEQRAARQELARALRAEADAARKTLRSEEEAQRMLEGRLEEARANLARAWGWYRDKDSMAAQMAEEKADAEAQKQFEKDFGRLKSRHRDWRTVENLSVDDEAVRRVALAREEEKAASEYVRIAAEETARAANALERIEATMAEGE